MLRELLAKFDISVSGEKEIKKADNSVGGLFETLKKFQSAIAGGVAVVAFRAFIEQMTVAGDQLGKASNRMGVTTEDFQRLAHAANLGGASISELEPALVVLQRNLRSANEGTGEFAKIFRDLGVSITDEEGNLASITSVLPQLSAGFQKVESSTEMVALATTVLGRSGANLLPMLKGDLPAAFAEVEQLGGGFSASSVMAAENLTDAFARLDLSMLSLKSAVYGQLAPGVQRIVDATRNVVVWFGKFVKGSEAITAAMAMVGVAAVALGVKILLPFLPAILVAAKFALVIGAIFLVLEDLISWFKGKKSVFGAILEGWFGKESSEKVHKFAQDVVGSVQWVFGLVTDLFSGGGAKIRSEWSTLWEQASNDAGVATSWIADVVGGLHAAAIQAFGSLQSGILQISADLWEGVALIFSDGITAALKPVQAALDALEIDTDLAEGIRALAEDAGKTAGQWRSRAAQIDQDAGGRASELLGVGRSGLDRAVAQSSFAPAFAGSASLGSVEVSQSNVVNVRVDGAKDPVAVARELGRGAGRDLSRFALQGVERATTRAAR